MMDLSNQTRDPAPALAIFTLTGRVILDTDGQNRICCPEKEETI